MKNSLVCMVGDTLEDGALIERYNDFNVTHLTVKEASERLINMGYAPSYSAIIVETGSNHPRRSDEYLFAQKVWDFVNEKAEPGQYGVVAFRSYNEVFSVGWRPTTYEVKTFGRFEDRPTDDVILRYGKMSSFHDCMKDVVDLCNTQDPKYTRWAMGAGKDPRTYKPALVLPPPVDRMGEKIRFYPEKGMGPHR